MKQCHINLFVPQPKKKQTKMSSNDTENEQIKSSQSDNSFCDLISQL